MKFVLLFQPTFAPLVESGAKRQTVRLTPKRMPMRGDHISLRTWAGKPYRSKQRILREVIVTDLQTIRVNYVRIELGGQPISPHDGNAFARDDGFSSLIDFIFWIKFTHGIPFEGICITWK